MSKTRYVIIKSTRWYEGGPGYAGPTCEAASVPPGKIYDSEDEATLAAARLNKCNMIGFTVEEYRPRAEVAE